MQEVGDFEVKSGELIITDPCYDEADYPNDDIHKRHKAKNGTWVAIKNLGPSSWGDRVHEIIAYHKDFPTGSFYEDLIGNTPVDSGQAGIFDAASFRNDVLVNEEMFNNPNEKICGDEPWYSLCCDRTIGVEQAGIVPNGVVSSSGFGDGSYDIFGMSHNDELVAVRVLFITENEEDEYDEYEEEEDELYEDEEDYNEEEDYEEDDDAYFDED